MAWAEIVGWAASIVILAGYALLSMGRIAARSWTYQGCNLLGGFGMALNGWIHGAFPSVFNNLIWMGIAALAMTRLAAGLRRTEPPVPPT